MDSGSRSEKRRKDHLCLKHWLRLVSVTMSEISEADVGIPTMCERQEVLESARLCPRCTTSSADAQVLSAGAELGGGLPTTSPVNVSGGEALTSVDWSVPPSYRGFGYPTTRRRPRGHKAWRIVWVSALATVVALWVLDLVHAPSAPSAPPPGAHAQQFTSVDLPLLREGDCLPSGTPRRVRTVEVGPCNLLHREEVYAVFGVEEGSYPGQGSVDRRGDVDCRERFEAYVGIAYEASQLDFYAITPDVRSLPEDRTVVCVVVDAVGHTGTLKGARR